MILTLDEIEERVALFINVCLCVVLLDTWQGNVLTGTIRMTTHELAVRPVNENVVLAALVVILMIRPVRQ